MKNCLDCLHVRATIWKGYGPSAAGVGCMMEQYLRWADTQKKTVVLDVPCE
jgi:hypothetical protein